MEALLYVSVKHVLQVCAVSTCRVRLSFPKDLQEEEHAMGAVGLIADVRFLHLLTRKSGRSQRIAL